MASDKPPVSRESVEHQDQSIKVRKSQLFEPKGPLGAPVAARPFADYLRAAPAAPLSPGVKATLWAVGVLVALLFLTAILTAGKSTRPSKGRAERPPIDRGSPRLVMAYVTDVDAPSGSVDA